MGLFHSIFGLPQNTGIQKKPVDKRISGFAGKDGVVLTKGQVIKGEVTDLRSNEVTIRLDDGKTLHAKLSTAMELSIGQQAEFFVQETGDTLIMLKLLSDGDSSFTESAIDKALEASGFPKSPHGAEIVRSLLTAGLPANKETIQKMMQYSASNKDVELSTLTALMKHNLPVTKENATGLQAYRNFEHRLLGQATTLTSALTEAFSYGEIPASFTERLLTQLFREDATASVSGNATADIQTNGTTEFVTSSNVPETLLSKTSETSLNTAPVPEHAPFINTGSTIQTEALASPESLTNTTGPDATLPSRSDEAVPLKQLLPESQYQAVEKALSTLSDQLPEYSAIKTGLTDGSLTTNQLFSALSSASTEGHAERITSLFKEEPALSELFGKTVLNRFVMTPEDLTKEKAVEEFYARLQKDLSAFSDTISGDTASSALKTVADTASHMQENLQFMNTLNQIFPYVQLPLKLTEQLTHGELYVYTKKKDLSAKNKEVSILLHLDMVSLGPTDIHLSLLQQNVTAKFYLNETDAETLVSEQLPFLTEALQKKGYSLNASVMHREKEPDIVTDFMADGDAVPMKRFRFDIRA